jgi:hypothetical protein
LRALWLDARGDWDAAHECVEERADRDSMWVHAYLHRKEGDAANARYWYARAGKPPCAGTLDEECRALAGALLGAEGPPMTRIILAVRRAFWTQGCAGVTQRASNSIAPTLDDARRRLCDVFGYEDFVPGQADAVAAVLAGEDVFAVMPTGSGKSLLIAHWRSAARNCSTWRRSASLWSRPSIC